MNALGAAIAAACDNKRVLARIGGVLGELARAGAATAFAREVTDEVRAPVPPGLRGVDPSWLEAALAVLPPRAREVLAAGPRDEADVWLARRACAGIPPLPPIEPALSRPRTRADLLRMAPRALRDWLVEVGRDHLAFAAGEHARVVPELAAAVMRIEQPPRAGELGRRRDAIARCGGNSEPFPIGVRALAPHVDALLAAALVRRFPHPDALGIASELTAHRDGRSGGWDALVAP